MTRAISPPSTTTRAPNLPSSTLRRAADEFANPTGSYLSDILPALLVASIGLGGVFTGATTAANAGVGEDRAGLAAGLLNTGQQLGAALGLAILSALATARTNSLLHAGHDTVAQAATHGYQRALLAGAGFVLAATVVAIVAPNTRQSEPAIEEEPVLDLAA
jgi:hypothetical protein